MKKQFAIYAILFAIIIGVTISYINLNHSNKKMEANNGEIRMFMSATWPHVTEKQLLDSDIIALGEVKGVEKEYTLHRDIPFSDFRFHVIKYIKAPENQSAPKELIITQDGNSKLQLSGYPLLKQGQKYLLYLEEKEYKGKKYLTIVGGPAGLFLIDNEKIKNVHDPKWVFLNQYLDELQHKLKP
ncbi:hypothetical protein [Polycladomyces subterraneus]|uniref:Uncharacterized protein n=1 Tax=Polycladomyces subterraneus TaxID=1016997 RepID=A0ABT8IRW3_9BACL|nr:hypothetical protein [Polycladomyces subterraneus]MDN4595201.1 hypothetical protein [Polycladomyces subterraneus]